MLFQDRIDAGQQLAQKLLQYKNDPKAVVIGLPRGGVVVAAEVAKILGLPLDIIVPRKIGAPGNPEFGLGALTEEGEPVFQEFIQGYDIPEEYLTMTVLKEKQEAQRRLKAYRGDRAPLNLRHKTVLLIDDGIATGSTMRAAILSAFKKGADKVVVAAPVIAPDTLSLLETEATEVVFVETPDVFGAVGQFYQEFEQTTDTEVIQLLQARR